MILSDRKRVLDTFEARHCAKEGRVFLGNTEAYRILNGEDFEMGENAQPSKEMKAWYKAFREKRR